MRPVRCRQGSCNARSTVGWRLPATCCRSPGSVPGQASGQRSVAALHSAATTGVRYACAMTTSFQISRRAQALTSSAIREILKVTERPEVISFAGGLPSPATFPVERMRAASDRVLRDAPQAALQYGPTEGYAPL
ncbi:PLP-dependent aminotransferase family protein, partial [Xanthomonas perforans]|nr:PLP-dependent aminotransferase family protein [Xanthomonas perforans]